MSEASTTEAKTAPASTAVAVRPVREVRVTTADRAVWDTADFEHTGRVAAVMADSQLLPMSFRGVMKGSGDNAVLEPFERSQVIANAMILCTIAREFEANPFLLMQCASLISGRIMLEGKVIAAAIAHRTGIRLRYEFGLWNGDHFEPVAEQAELHGAGERLAVRVIGQFPDEDEPRTVEGSVGQWKTTRTGSPWSKIADWPRQLRYRGAREWGRAHAPGVTLGMYGDGDDFDEDFTMEPQPRKKRDLAGKLGAKGADGPQEGENGFDRAGVAAALGDGPVAAPEGSEPIEDAEFEDRSTTSEAEAPTSDGAEPESVNGPAPAGEQYFLVGDGLTADGRRLTYIDGIRFSTTKTMDKFKVYAQHAPEKVDLGVPCEDCGAPAGEECKPDCPGAAEDMTNAAISDGGERVDPAQAQSETGFLATLAPMKSWADEFKPAIAALFKTSDWTTAAEADKNEMRRAIWDTVLRSGASVDQADDPSAYGLWLSAQGNSLDDADAVEGTFRVLKASERWAKMSDGARKPLEDRTAAKLTSIRG